MHLGMFYPHTSILPTISMKKIKVDLYRCIWICIRKGKYYLHFLMQIWLCKDPYESLWIHLNLNMDLHWWLILIPYAYIWICMDPNKSIWFYMDLHYWPLSWPALYPFPSREHILIEENMFCYSNLNISLRI